ncbi:F-box family protein [Artemisia annua]|uniref:F-box family protein n=1 Tax=Artemisia annua TaxID=35608 RepID=A0A2U1LCE7_ARTAN|nr:F-box family protein [Artemisia annua]
MSSSRAKIKKTQNTPRNCLLEAYLVDYDHQLNQSAALIGSNDDLLTEILLRLPAISILRFKSVSKHWRALLSHRQFTLRYDRVSICRGLYASFSHLYIPFDAENKSSPPLSKLDFYPDPNGIRIIQQCNGLLLCGSNVWIPRRGCRYYVFNPVTKQHVVLPMVRGGWKVRKHIRFIGLAYRQSDPVSYKVVCIFRPKRDGEVFYIQIYSSKTGEWKIANESFSTPHYRRFGEGVYWNGAILWPPSCLDPLYFDLNVEKFKKLPLPSASVASLEGLDLVDIPFYFGESRGHLHLVELAHPEKHFHLNVYEMLCDHSGWFLKYQVDLDELSITYPEMIISYAHPSFKQMKIISNQDLSSPKYYFYEVLDVVRGDKEEDTFMVVRIPSKIIRYNILDKSFKLILDIDFKFLGRIGYNGVHRYIETITSF